MGMKVNGPLEIGVRDEIKRGVVNVNRPHDIRDRQTSK